MNQKEFAKHIGVSQPRVSKYIRDGLLKESVSRNGRYVDIDAAKGVKELNKKLDPGRKVKAKAGGKKRGKKKKAVDDSEKKDTASRAGTGGVDMATARALNEQYKAALKKLEFDQRKGVLVNIEDMKRLAFEAGKQIKEHCLAIPDRCGPLVAANSDAFECKQILLEEITMALENLSEVLRKIR